MAYEREQSETLRRRLAEPPRFLIVVAGPRQIGKTTMVREVLRGRPTGSSRYLAVDDPGTDLGFSTGETVRPLGSERDADWLVRCWTEARSDARDLRAGERYVMAVDEIQKIKRWPEVVKGLWDEDRAVGLNLHVVLLGSSPWLMHKGLTESLAGRYEMLRMTHWSLSEMQAAFDLSLDEYLFFGGYPGTIPLVREESRWRQQVRDALVRPTIETDILQTTRVDKPALLKALFELGCAYSGQIISYTKLQGQLQDAGNTVTLAHYLDLLSKAGFLTGLAKYAGQRHRQRASSPKLNALNTALMSALAGYSFDEAKGDRSHWGRLVETAVGAHLCNTAPDGCEVQYWRESPHEVDFVLVGRRKVVAIEVKSGAHFKRSPGLDEFVGHFPQARRMVVGQGGVPLVEFLRHSCEHWLTSW